jgi:hypothetical protein
VLTDIRKRQIENEAIRLRTEIWEERSKYWPGRHPHPFDVLEPQIAANHLGYEMHFVPDLSLPLGDANAAHETAGVLDQRGKRILVADCFGAEVRRFTAAHELGHIVLMHDDKNHLLHRDMPIVGLEQQAHDPVEREANFFAGCYLIPPKFLAKIVENMFGAAPLVFNYAAASWLRPNDLGSLLYAPEGSLVRYRAIATARSFAGRQFGGRNLADLFKVSVGTMAIRLRERDLVNHAIES